ncbi:MAG: TIGR03086 family metal-binding protein [Actinomycetes bacterium]
MTVRDLMPTAARRVAAVARGAAQADLHNPTPCTDFDLGTLVTHFAGTTSGMVRAARREALDPRNPWGAPPGLTEGDWASDLADNVEEVGQAWSDPEAWTGSVDLAGSSMPASMCGGMAFVEILLHGWDLAAASGQQLQLDPGVGEELRRVIAETAEHGRQMHAYGPEVPVPASADDFDHALGLAGRDPGWQAPA